MGDLNLAIDIETVGIPPSDEEVREYEATLSPPGNYKSETAIEKWWNTTAKDKVREYKNKRALELGGAKICSVALALITQDGLENHYAKASENEEEVMLWTVDELNSFGASHTLVTFNGRDFDLPQMSLKIAKYGLRLEHPIGRYDSIDLFLNPPVNRKAGLKRVAEVFGVAQAPHLFGLDGTSVAELYADKDFETIERYNLDDVRMTAELYQLFSRFYNLG